MLCACQTSWSGFHMSDGMSFTRNFLWNYWPQVSNPNVHARLQEPVEISPYVRAEIAQMLDLAANSTAPLQVRLFVEISWVADFVKARWPRIRQGKGAQRQSFGSGHLPLGWGSSTVRVGAKKSGIGKRKTASLKESLTSGPGAYQLLCRALCTLRRSSSSMRWTWNVRTRPSQTSGRSLRSMLASPM